MLSFCLCTFHGAHRRRETGAAGAYCPAVVAVHKGYGAEVGVAARVLRLPVGAAV